MNPFRSVGARLGLGLAIVVAAALVLVDLIVVPSLERNLIDAKLSQLEEAAPRVAIAGPERRRTSRSIVAMQAASESANARVVYFTPLNLEPAEAARHRRLERRHLSGRRGRPGGPAGAAQRPCS